MPKRKDVSEETPSKLLLVQELIRRFSHQIPVRQIWAQIADFCDYTYLAINSTIGTLCLFDCLLNMTVVKTSLDDFNNYRIIRLDQTSIYFYVWKNMSDTLFVGSPLPPPIGSPLPPMGFPLTTPLRQHKIIRFDLTNFSETVIDVATYHPELLKIFDWDFHTVPTSWGCLLYSHNSPGRNEFFYLFQDKLMRAPDHFPIINSQLRHFDARHMQLYICDRVEITVVPGIDELKLVDSYKTELLRIGSYFCYSTVKEGRPQPSNFNFKSSRKLHEYLALHENEPRFIHTYNDETMMMCISDSKNRKIILFDFNGTELYINAIFSDIHFDPLASSAFVIGPPTRMYDNWYIPMIDGMLEIPILTDHQIHSFFYDVPYDVPMNIKLLKQHHLSILQRMWSGFTIPPSTDHCLVPISMSTFNLNALDSINNNEAVELSNKKHKREHTCSVTE
jgi:hypothetical protein